MMSWLPGACASNKFTTRSLIKAAAELEKIELDLDTISRDSNSNDSYKNHPLAAQHLTSLHRQNAIDSERELTSDIKEFSLSDSQKRNSFVKSISDPCKFVMKEVQAVQESIPERNESLGKRRKIISSGYGSRSGEENVTLLSGLKIDTPTDNLLEDDGSEMEPVFDENHTLQQGSSSYKTHNQAINPFLENNELEGNQTSSLMFEKIPSDLFDDKKSHGLNLTKEYSMDDSILALHASLLRHGITNRFQKHESWKNVDISSLQHLVSTYLKSPKTRRIAVTKTEQPCYEHETSSSNFDTEYSHDIQRELDKSARCCDNFCHSCSKIRSSVESLSQKEVSVHKMSIYQEKLLMNMYHHSSRCDLIRCPFYWCDILPKNPFYDRQEILAFMKQRVEHNALELFLEGLKSEVFVQFHSDFSECPEEDIDWTALVRMGQSRNTMMALPTKQDTAHDLNYWVIKKVPLCDEEVTADPSTSSQLELYQRLRKIKHPGIVQPLWAMISIRQSKFVVCTSHQGISLKEIIQNNPNIHFKILLELVLQVIEALLCIHGHGILFLNWSASNIILAENQAKLADFTASALMNQNREEMMDYWEAIMGYLPCHLHPPELLGLEKTLDEKSDIWGLGCLLNEVMTGKQVWHEYQHQTQDDLHKVMSSKKKPEIPSSLKKLSNVFEACWQVDRSRRKGLNEICEMLRVLLH